MNNTHVHIHIVNVFGLLFDNMRVVFNFRDHWLWNKVDGAELQEYLNLTAFYYQIH